MLAGLTAPGSRRALIAALLLPALLFRAAIPAGFMPVFGAQGGVGVAICPGIQAHQHQYPHQHGQPGTGGSASHGQMCPFALSAGPALAFAPDLQAALPVRLTFVAIERAPTLAVDAIERAQSARGPPATLRI